MIAHQVMTVDQLPADWVEIYDNTYKRNYYYNRVTKESSWTKPASITVDQLPADWVEIYDNTYKRNYYYNRVTKESSWTKPASITVDQLPADWVEIYDNTYKRNYYFNRVTKESSWTKPASIAVDQLPADWVEIYDNTYKRNYYFNRVTKESSWTKPASITDTDDIADKPSQVQMTRFEKHSMQYEIHNDIRYVGVDGPGGEVIVSCIRFNSSSLGSDIIVAYPDGKKVEGTVNALYCINDDGSALVFSIRRFFEKDRPRDKGGRLHIVVYCYNTETQILRRSVYYSSISDGSFWRYCITYPRRYDKGINYISTTFINVELQKFLFNEQSEFDIQKSDTNPMKKCIKTYSLSTGQFYERFKTRKYMSTHPFFMILDYVFPHIDPVRLIGNYNLATERLENFIDNKIQSEDTEEAKEIGIIYFDSISNTDKPNEIHLSYATDLFNTLSRKNVLKYDSEIYGSRTSFLIRWYQTIMEEFWNIFEITSDDVPELIFENRKVIIQGYNLIFTVKRIKITDKSDSSISFFVYYMEYLWIDDNKKRRQLLHIVPANSTINEHGLDDMYVSSGMLINKIFEYKQQMNITLPDRDQPPPQQRRNNYVYIGNIYDISESTGSLDNRDE
jgi:WW domain